MNICMTNNVFPVGPNIAYGGERIIYYLTEALIKRGHKVWLFSREGTTPPAGVEDYIPVDAMCEETDVYYDAASAYLSKNPHVNWDVYECNYFGNGFNPKVKELAKAVCELTWCAWCHCQPFGNWNSKNILSYSRLLQADLESRGVPSTMIHYGIPKDLYTPSYEHDGYAVWIAKMEGGKRPDLAIELAKAAGLKIVIMGPPYNTNCFWQMVAPYIDNKNVFWVRGVDDEQKRKIMSRAKVFISSNDNSWREHFGITNAEALACGTPIIAFNRINQECAIWTDQIIEEGKQGYFLNYHNADDLNEILTKGVPLVKAIDKIDRGACRERFEAMFTSDLMASRYEYFYNHILNNGDVDSLEIPF